MANNVVNISKKRLPYFGSISFLVLVVLLTVSLFFYNNSIIKQNQNLETQISTYDFTISDIEKDDSFKINSLLEANKKTIEGLIRRTNISKYINHMESIMEEYDLVFRGFRISGLDLETSVLLKTDENGLAYKKVVNFVNKYRNTKDALFNLNFVNRVSGYDDIKININFEIK